MNKKKVTVLLLTIALFIPQVVVFFASAEEDYTIDLSSPYDEWLDERNSYIEDQPEVSEEIKSKDGKYAYVLNKETGEAYFSHAFEKNLKVLNIPEEIDGHRIVGAINGNSESPYLFEVNYSKYIKDIYFRGLNFSKVPSCKLNLNEGLEVIHKSAFTGIKHTEAHAEVHLDEIVFPTTLKEIKPDALDPNIKRIVFQSDPIVDLSHDWLDTLSGITATPYDYMEIYYTGDALKATDKSFCYWHSDFETPLSLVFDATKVYHKPGAKGFDKLKEAGYKVEEYTEEVWKNQKTKNPATKIVIDDMIVKIPLKKNVWVKAKVFPENADAPRIWYYPQDSYYNTSISLTIDGKLIRGYQGRENSVKVTAVADCGLVTEFTITLTDKDVPTSTTKPVGTSSTKKTPDSSSTQSTTAQNATTKTTDAIAQNSNKTEDANIPKTGIQNRAITIVAVFTVATLTAVGVAVYVIKKKNAT